VDSIALLPGLIAIWVLSRSGLESAFLNVYLPALLVLPWYRCNLPGIPDPSFSQSAMVPVAIVFLWRSRFRWQFSAMDLVVFSFAAWAILAEYVTNGYVEAQNVSFDAITQGVLAYLLGKVLIGSQGNEAKFARRFVFCLFLICVASVYEFRFSVNPFKGLIGRFFPGQGSEVAWNTQIRWGLGRVTGPFAHSIIAGMTIMSGVLVNLWLIKAGKWEKHFRWLTGLPFGKGKLIATGLVAGLLMTMSRGPWVSGVFGVALAAVGAARNPKRALSFALAFGILAGAATWAITANYTSVGQEGPQTPEQESAVYRANLLDRYRDIALQRPVWGWGSRTYPRVGGMESIDNAYLLMMLMHGITYTAIFGLFLVLMVVRLVRAGLKADSQKCAVLFALAGVIVSFIVSLGTAWLPPDTQAVLFLFAGWAEGRIIEKPVKLTEKEEEIPVCSPYRFERVYV
jgi:hypothetical protein